MNSTKSATCLWLLGCAAFALARLQRTKAFCASFIKADNARFATGNFVDRGRKRYK